jgi:hypothetical protein
VQPGARRPETPVLIGESTSGKARFLRETLAMKTLFFVVCVLAATAAFGQTASVIPSQAYPITISDHPQHASQHSMAGEQSILETNCNLSAHGERPLWEFAPTKVEIPLGDIARELRRQRDVFAVKKSNNVVEN